MCNPEPEMVFLSYSQNVMKIVATVLLAASAAGCSSYIEILDVTAERGDADDLVVRFKADRDVTEAAQWPGAALFVASQADLKSRDGVEARDFGHVQVSGARLNRVQESPGPSGLRYTFRASFPLRGAGDEYSFPYDLSRAGVHELEFWTRGGSCWFGPSYYSNRVRLAYKAP